MSEFICKMDGDVKKFTERAIRVSKFLRKNGFQDGDLLAIKITKLHCSDPKIKKALKDQDLKI